MAGNAGKEVKSGDTGGLGVLSAGGWERCSGVGGGQIPDITGLNRVRGFSWGP